MKHLWMATGLLFIYPNLINGQTILTQGTYDSTTQVQEITQKYEKYSGSLSNQSVKLWDEYFFESPNIGNIHNGQPQIGWLNFHKSMKQIFDAGMPGKFIIKNLEIFPISFNSAWVRGTIDMELGMNSSHVEFFDALIKTDLGWRVTMSVVNPKSTPIDIDTSSFNAFVGSYEIQPQFAIDIVLEEGRLMAQGTGQPKIEIVPETQSLFGFKGADISIEFIKNSSGDYSHLILNQNGNKIIGVKKS